MPIEQVDLSDGYTLVPNNILRDQSLTPAAAILLIHMIGKAEGWNFSTRGLAAISNMGVNAASNALKLLERLGYLKRRRLRDSRGRISDTEYIIYVRPRPPDTENRDMDEPDMVQPSAEIGAQYNKERPITKRINTNRPNINSLPFVSGETDGKRIEAMAYRDLICERIDYDGLCRDLPHDRDRLDELVELMVETVSSAKKRIRVARDTVPIDVVKSRLLKLERAHIAHVLSCLQENTTNVRNIKAYLLTALFNAPATMANHYTAQVGHDLYGTKEDFS